MNIKLTLIGLAATLFISLVLPIYSWLEPAQQETLVSHYRSQSVLRAADLYAENCVVCHGASGEGIAGNPPLNLAAVQSMSSSDLIDVIADGRYNTQMAGWSTEAGGILTMAQVQDLSTMIQYANWAYVEARVAELGLTPPQVIALEVSDEMLTALSSLDDGQRLADGLTVYAQNCAACHNADASGTLIAPALDSIDIRQTPLEELREIVNLGVPGTLMAGWENTLGPVEVDGVLALIQRWPEVVAAGVEFPQVEMTSLPSSPEMIAEGRALYQVACQSCHGFDAYGSPMAPALNNELFLTETPDGAIYQIIAGGVLDTMMPAWGSRLTDYDIQTLVAYLRSLEPTAPPIVPPIVD
ncbi:MAG: c-type cytochrome [Anaerolineales bacterium]|jgi:cytochrome c oxidase cbb3-type subunit 3